jgi:hypothetical protein
VERCAPCLVAREDRQLAGAVRKQLLQEIERLVHGLRVREGSEVARRAVAERARAQDARKVLAERDLHVGVGLVVLEADVVARLVLLDEARLEEVGLGDRARDRELDAFRALDHADVADVQAGAEVGTDPVPQDVGLAHIKDAAAAVLEQVNARRVREGRDLGLEALAALVLVHGQRSNGYPFTRRR